MEEPSSNRTSVKNVPLEIKAFNMPEDKARDAEKEIAEKLQESFSKMSCCEKAAFSLGILMMKHNISNIKQLTDIFDLCSHLIEHELNEEGVPKSYKISKELLKLFEQHPTKEE